MSSELSVAERVNLLEQMQEQDANRRRKTVLAAWGSVGIATLVLALLVFGAGWQLRKIRAEREVEAKNLLDIQRKKEATQIELDKADAKLKEVQAQLAAAAQLLGRTAQAQGKEAFEKELSTDPKAAQLLPRAYLQIVDEQDRDWAKAMRRRLEDSGIIVPGIELVPSAVGLKRTDVRYYKKSELAGAERIVAVLKAAGVDAALNPLNQENNTGVRPNHFEVWFAAGSRNQR